MRSKPVIDKPSTSLDSRLKRTLLQLYRRKAKLDRLIRRLKASRYSSPRENGSNR